ncbi:hypothetical protein [Corallincola spongiicola]|uniref:Uncharacterized protein n=1 Tax=Corallincola spongiicola TaxID=2520508 RepID=A0ABY1WQY1_9GAMM|nr:hypothetical protein [Corallincola spongiicola]TAA47125.1 hypothetical protein EXY25_07735 [Corallincola spongiicola]
MNDSQLFILFISMFFGFFAGTKAVRNLKSQPKGAAKVFALCIGLIAFTAYQYFQYQAALEVGGEIVQIMKPFFFGSVGFGGILACAGYRMVKI